MEIEDITSSEVNVIDYNITDDHPYFNINYTSQPFVNRDFNASDLHTSAEYHDYGVLVIVILCVAYGVIFTLALGGNLSVVFVITKHKSMRTRTNLLLCNLAVADILVAITDVPLAMSTILTGDFVFHSSPHRDIFCSINGFIVGLGIMVSIHTLMWISVHKFISITGVFGRTVSLFHIGLMIAGTWCWCIFYNLTGTPLIGMSSIVYKKGASQCGPEVPHDMKSYLHALINTTFNFIIPIIVMGVCYWKIFSVVREHLSSMGKFADDGRRNTMIEQKRILSTLVVVMTCFICCYLPYIFYTFTLIFKTFEPNILVLNPLAYLFIYLNSACNPIIYALRSPSFRKGFKGCFKCLGKDVYNGRAGSQNDYRVSILGRSWKLRKLSFSSSLRKPVLKKKECPKIFEEPSHGVVEDIRQSEKTIQSSSCGSRLNTMNAYKKRQMYNKNIRHDVIKEYQSCENLSVTNLTSNSSQNEKQCSEQDEKLIDYSKNESIKPMNLLCVADAHSPLSKSNCDISNMTNDLTLYKSVSDSRLYNNPQTKNNPKKKTIFQQPSIDFV